MTDGFGKLKVYCGISALCYGTEREFDFLI